MCGRVGFFAVFFVNRFRTLLHLFVPKKYLPSARVINHVRKLSVRTYSAKQCKRVQKAHAAYALDLVPLWYVQSLKKRKIFPLSF